MRQRSELDILMAAAWPAAVVESRGTWQLRYTYGVSRRANSVLAVGEPSSLAAAIDEAEAFYVRRGAPSMFQISEASAPRALVELLGSRGYESSATTWVLWADADVVVASLPDPGPWSLESSPASTEEWFDTYWSTESDWHTSEREATVIRDVLLRPDSPCLFVSARGVDGGVAAVGQAVLSRGWACVQCLATRTEARRRGAARAVVHGLAAGSIEAGTDRMFAAVMAGNAPSLALFESASFRRSHTYSYLTRA